MKATRNTNSNRILTTIGLLIFAISLGYGQGLLAEGAMKLFKINKPTIEVDAPQFVFVNHTPENDANFKLKNFVKDAFTVELEVEENNDVNIARTIHVSAVEISFEAEIETEEWMTTPLENNLEAGIEIESWMTTPMENNLEAGIAVESWMTESFNETVESDLKVENWMTNSFTASVETELTTEEWMTQSISKSLECDVEVEDWMTVSFTEAYEEELTVEDWMTQSLISK